jgi:hypothetical protein
VNNSCYARPALAPLSILAAAALAGGVLVRNGLAQTVKEPLRPAQVQKPSQSPTPVTTAAPGLAAPQDGDDVFQGELGDGSDKTGIWQVRNWTYTRNDMVVTGTTGLWNKKADTLDTNDPVVMDDKKHHVTADKAHIEHVRDDPDKRLVVLTGHAIMVLKPDEPASGVAPAAVEAPGAAAQGQPRTANASDQAPGSPQTDQKSITQPPAVKLKDPQSAPDNDRQNANKQKGHGGTITCDKIEYKTRKKFATLTGHVVFKQSFADDNGKHIERTMNCEHAENDDKANKLKLFKPVHYEDSEKQVLETNEDVIVGTKDGDETLSLKNFVVHFPSESADDDDNGSTDKPGSKAALDKGDKKRTP